MSRRPGTTRRRVIVWGIVPLAAAVLAEEKPRPLEGGEKVSVTFNLLVTPREAATLPGVSMGPIDLAVGETMVGNGTAHPFAFGAAGDPDGCGAGVGIEPVEVTLARYRMAWTADVKVMEASTDELVLSGGWERFTRGADGRRVRAGGASIPRLSLREGERVLLDLVAPPSSGEPTCMRNFALELTAQVKEDPALANSQIAYDLWLLHETKDGKRTTARTQLTASQGERLSFAFPKEKLPASPSGGEDDQKLEVAFTGKVRGRVRSDGRVAVSLDTHRMLSYVAPDGSNDGGIGEGGEKMVDVRPGEAVRVELPDPARGVARGDPRAPRMARDLAGHSFALVLSARPLS